MNGNVRITLQNPTSVLEKEKEVRIQRYVLIKAHNTGVGGFPPSAELAAPGQLSLPPLPPHRHRVCSHRARLCPKLTHRAARQYPERKSRFSEQSRSSSSTRYGITASLSTCTTKTLNLQHHLLMVQAHTKHAFLLKNTWYGLCSLGSLQMDKRSIYIAPKTTACPH